MRKEDVLLQQLRDQVKGSKKELHGWIKRRKQAEEKIAELTRFTELTQTMIAYLEGQTEAISQVLPGFEHEPVVSERFKDMTIVDCAFEILKEASGPLHVQRILAFMKAGGRTLKSKTPRISVSSALLRDDRFENIGKNTFTIKEVGSSTDEKS